MMDPHFEATDFTNRRGRQPETPPFEHQVGTAKDKPTELRRRLATLITPDACSLIEEWVRELAAEVAREELARAAFQKPAFYTVEEAARRLGISPAAVRMRAKRGRLVTRRQGRRLYVAATSVDDLESGGGRC